MKYLKKNIKFDFRTEMKSSIATERGSYSIENVYGLIRFEANVLGLCSQMRANGLFVYNTKCFGEVAGIQSLRASSVLLYTDIEKEGELGPFTVDMWALEALQQVARFKSIFPESRSDIVYTKILKKYKMNYTKLKIQKLYHSRKIFAAFAVDETSLFSSCDIQYLRIGTVLKGGILLPPSFYPSSASEHSYNLMSVACTPQRGLEVTRDFLSLFSTEASMPQGQGGLIFEIKFRAEQFWQIKVRFLLSAASAQQLDGFICSQHLSAKKEYHVEKITVPESTSEVWRRICHGLQEKRSLNIVSSHEKDMIDIPCPATKLSCYAATALQAPTGILNTLECVGFPRQQAVLPSLELISSAMEQIPNFQKFLKETKFEREMEGQEMCGIMIAAVASCVMKFSE